MQSKKGCLIRLAFLGLLAIAAFRLSLPLAARVLIVEDAITPSDAIIVLAGNRFERVYEAAALYREGAAPRIILSKPFMAENRALDKKVGVQLPSHNDLQHLALQQMGVPSSAVEDMEARMFSTRDEARVLSDVASQRRYRSVIIATSPYHSRRARIYFRSAANNRFEVRVRPSRFESIDPARWWRRPTDRVDVVLEWLKLPGSARG